MKILFVIDTLYSTNNGTSISALRYADELRRRGHIVRALCGDTPNNEEQAAVTEHDYCTGILHIPFFQPLIQKHGFCFAKAGRSVHPMIHEACEWADIVHVFIPFFLDNIAIDYCKKIGKPITGAFHLQAENITSSFGLGKVQFINDFIYAIFRRTTYNRLRHVHTPSQFMADSLRQHGYTSRLHVISNGIKEAFMEAGEIKKGQRNTYREADRSTAGKLEIPSTKGVFKIMMVGRLSREKRQDVIIRAMHYSRYADRIQLVFAGQGPEYKRYLHLSRGLKHPPRFIYKQQTELIEELLTTDLYVHASDMESEAISCIEAFATGLVPVIADSDNSATPQFALDGRSLFAAGNPKDLARAIDYWLDQPDERHYMEQLYRVAGREYSLTKSVAEFEKMLKKEIADCTRNNERK